ncbi:hypothetical protein Bxe_A3506 [Paraburkholderia xenovorans LB400]|uniref:Uncharacterized protein n=1 Tax=Paraburkholderia xenovorans (strain LB400) TaxID=266265 RepID=Q143L0_PARXL|nr:hypothetical protein Bxe_A3506 [Paraburkholderia xenovorans LB400]
MRVTLSDVPEVLLTATNSEPPVQDAGLAAKAGTLFRTASDFGSVPFFFGCRFFERCFLHADFFCIFKPLTFNHVQFDSCATG